jgi:hypothetical protein
MDQGLENFRSTAPLVLVYNYPKLKRVKIVDKRKEGHFSEEVFEVVNVKQLIGGLNLVSVANGSKDNLRYIVEQRDRAAHLILQVSAPVKGEPFTILPRQPK